jgi:predicted transcriptional regulator
MQISEAESVVMEVLWRSATTPIATDDVVSALAKPQQW